MHVIRLCLNIILLVAALTLGAYFLAVVSSAQTLSGREFKPDVRGAQRMRTRSAVIPRPGGYAPQRNPGTLAVRSRVKPDESSQSVARRPVRIAKKDFSAASTMTSEVATQLSTRIRAGTPLSRVLHTAQLSLTSSAGSNEQYVDRNGDLTADERTTFDAGDGTPQGGSFDITIGRSGTRYEVYTAINDNGTPNNLNDDFSIGVVVVANDTNGDYVRDSSTSYDLERHFNLPSAIAAVSGTSKAGREFVIVSSSGYYNFDNPNDPENEPSAGVVLLTRDAATGGIDISRSRALVSVGSNQLNNANALALLPNNDLLIADFASNELRIVRDTNADGVPDTLDPVPFYSYQFSDDAPLDIAANSRGVVFSHSVGNDAIMLALYDDNNNGVADREEVISFEGGGLSLDNNLVFHGLTIDREGTVYIIEDASGAADLIADGGNLGTPRILAFPDPALNGILRDGSIYAEADSPNLQALSGLSFGVDTIFGPVGRLTMTNSASLRGQATRNGLATISGTNLTRGAQGASESDALARGVRVTIEGRNVPVLSFNDSKINIHVPDAAGMGVGSIVVSVSGNVTAADDVSVTNANPGIFTVPQTGAGESIALLTSGMRYTKSPFPSKFNSQPSVIALFGTGWRNSLPVTVRIGGQAATIEYAGPSGGFPGLDQINVRLPAGVTGTVPVVVTTASGALSRTDTVVTIQ
ncbi:MAG TPA: IPT/TIG domain-containing protein [Pyrinomonadaceae bacterium]|jgi:uncharacterized protein (TIGR03437 family)